MKQKLITSWDDVPIVMDLPFASRIVGQSAEYLKKRAQKGAFPAYKEGEGWRVTKEALKEHIGKTQFHNNLATAHESTMQK